MNLKLASLIESIPKKYIWSEWTSSAASFSDDEFPANSIIISWYGNGHPFGISYRKADHHHRIDGPARTLWYENGGLLCQEWYLDGKYHRDYNDGPAIIHWDKNGLKNLETYIEHNLSPEYLRKRAELLKKYSEEACVGIVSEALK